MDIPAWLEVDMQENLLRRRWGRRRHEATRIALVVLLGALTAGVGGCVSNSQSTAEAGPFPARYRELAKEYLRRSLLDPYSVRDAEIAEPTVKASFYLVDPAPGWTICVRYNAKNRLGAYTGITENALLVRGDRVSISMNELTTPTPMAGICRDAKWSAFTELGA
jgi:hypothetical protein